MTRATSASVRLFVYGSLKRAGRHHDVLQAAAATFLGAAQTVSGYRLIALGEYLALVPAPPGATDVVQGELYEVPESQLPALDAFEGDAYVRRRLEIRLLVSGAPKARQEAGAPKARQEAGAPKARQEDGAPKARQEDGSVAVEESLAYFKKAR